MSGHQRPSPKISDPKKQRDKDSMETFDCHGWIRVIVDNRLEDALVKISHLEDHIPYCVIDIPDDVKKVVSGSVNKTVSQVSWNLCVDIILTFCQTDME
jgi:hypothetical protein